MLFYVNLADISREILLFAGMGLYRCQEENIEESAVFLGVSGR